MRYRQLGRSGLMVSTFTLGTMTFGATGDLALTGNTDVEGARRQIDIAIDAGVNLIDTANYYSYGRSEEIVGKAIAGKRDDVLLSTKVRFSMGKGPNAGGLTRHHILQQIDASLRRLGTDHVDIYHVHEWDGLTPLEETLETLDGLVRAGKVRYLGVSNYAGWELMKALSISDARGWQRFVSNQIYYTLESRDAEYELVPVSLDQGLGLMVWSPLAGGLLSGKYRRGQQATEGRHLSAWSEPPVRDSEKLYDTIEVLVGIAERHDVSAAQVALAYLLAKPGVTTLVVGARKDEQLIENLRAADLELSAAEIDELDEVSAPPLIYPFWHQLANAGDRLGYAESALFGPKRPIR
jgi:aryl-alcohol dehydrogenase-like predicted oxidoreductase